MTAYDPGPFWDDYVRSLEDLGPSTPEHKRQEVALRAVLKPLWWRSVLEVGVGGGRITNLLHEMRPKSKFTGIDIGQLQLDAAKPRWPNGEFEIASIADFDPGERQWDLVIASEVLMHVTPDRIADAVANLLRSARKHVVTVDWDATPDELLRPIAPWNFPHDYRALFGDIESETRTDRQTIFHIAMP